ncbi:golgi transport 1B [Sparganum proliferum]
MSTGTKCGSSCEEGVENSTAACVSNFTRLKEATGIVGQHIYLQKIGLALMSVGIAFIFLGMLLLFDGGLLALGNWHKVKGTSFFFGGMLVVIFGFPLIGMLIELYGSFLLFSGFLPVVFNFLYRVPVIGWLLTLPGINRVTSAISGQSKSMV